MQKLDKLVNDIGKMMNLILAANDGSTNMHRAG
jgi:hypothetical protein